MITLIDRVSKAASGEVNFPVIRASDVIVRSAAFQPHRFRFIEKPKLVRK